MVKHLTNMEVDIMSNQIQKSANETDNVPKHQEVKGQRKFRDTLNVLIWGQVYDFTVTSMLERKHEDVRWTWGITAEHLNTH